MTNRNLRLSDPFPLLGEIFWFYYFNRLGRWALMLFFWGFFGGRGKKGGEREGLCCKKD